MRLFTRCAAWPYVSAAWAALISFTLTAQSGIEINRVIAWGDLSYNLPFKADSSAVSQLAPGNWHSLLLKKDGGLLAWGDDRFNQTNIPSSVCGAQTTQIAAGNIHSLALTSSGQVIAWGPATGTSG